MTPKDQAEKVVRRYVEEFVRNCRAAGILREPLDKIGIGLFPLVDHITVRTLDVDRRGEGVIRLGV